MRSLLSQRVYQANRRSAFWTMYGRPIEEGGVSEDEAEAVVDVVPTAERKRGEPGGDLVEDG